LRLKRDTIGGYGFERACPCDRRIVLKSAAPLAFAREPTSDRARATRFINHTAGRHGFSSISFMGTLQHLPPFPEAPEVYPSEPRISIVVNNRNYDRFVGEAIESALGQPGEVEVVIVDDGSTDESRAVIERYPGVRAVFQPNQGQKAAFNAGFVNATGDVVFFLDADDMLEPGIVEEVSRAFTRNPGTSRVVFRLQVVDEDGRPTGAYVPSEQMPLPSGDVRTQVLAFPDDLAWPPTSGNAFAAWALRRVMPLASDEDPTGADSALHPLIPLFGPVVALDRVGGSYRLHRSNTHLRARFDVERSRIILRRAQKAHSSLDRLAQELGYGRARPRSVTIAAHRLISLRLGGPGHPIADDNRWSALRTGLRAARGRMDVGRRRRTMYAAWFLAAAVAPRRAVGALAAAALQPTAAPPFLRRLAGR
jgi:glycosyltransferase involved in cell wall biosynthesis